MIVAIGFCVRCDAPVELDDADGYTEDDMGSYVLCEFCADEENEAIADEQNKNW